jgi:flagellar hook-basal body complex protein FliE
MVLPVNLPAGSLVIGGTVTTPGGAGAVPSAPSFAAHYLESLANVESQANASAAAFAQGGGPSVAVVMAQNAQADLAAQEFSLVVGKALQAYQSIMNMQV